MKFSSYNLFFKALSNQTRFEIINCLRKEKKSVGEIVDETGFEQSRISHNLAHLEAWGFVKSKKDGKRRIYELESNHIKPILGILDEYLSEYNKKINTCGILNGEGTCIHLKKEE